jgi:uroporphyrinogen-III synthase
MPGSPEMPGCAEKSVADFDCLLITRPQAEAEDLAARLSLLDIDVVLQPAHEFSRADISTAELEGIASAAATVPQPLLVFTSTRAVQFALQQLPLPLLQSCRLAAIGQATAAALQDAGLEEVLLPESGYRSEDLLQTLDAKNVAAQQAWIVAAAGGRQALLEGLRQRGLDARMLLVYRRQPAPVPEGNQQALQQSRKVLSVWTSADAMQQLSRGLSPAAWRQVCAGEWLVISQRLARSAEALCATVVHQAAGPGNTELAAAIREICAVE